jgi:glycosyltransferase involved in cell wall biosynthesis
LSKLKNINKLISSSCAVIPFYNEKKTLQAVLEQALKYVQVVFAVNDGSDDDDYQYLRYNNRVKLISLGKNYGKGKALSAGFENALSAGFEAIITIDADLQHDPDYVPSLIDGLQSFDIVIGNRLKNFSRMPFPRKLSNTITSFLLTVKTGQEIADSQCGFRAYRAEVIRIVKTKYPGFEAESEILVKAAKKGFKIGFTDIPTIYAGEQSKMKPFRAIVGFLKVLFLKPEN